MSDANLAHIISHVAALINDAEHERFTRDSVEAALKKRRTEARYWQLDALPTRASGGTITYVSYAAPYGWEWWGKDASLLDYNYDALTPQTSDWNTGRWTFATEPTRPVYILGFSYDVYAAAADLLEQRGAQLSEDIQTFSVAHGSFTYANRRSGPLELAKEYRRKQRPSNAVVYRTDVNP